MDPIIENLNKNAGMYYLVEPGGITLYFEILDFSIFFPYLFIITRSAVISWSSKILYRTNFNDLEIEVPVLHSLQQTNDFALILALVLKVIISVLVILSILLIYALLTIGVKSKIWEMGVLRGGGKFQIIF